MGYSQDKPETRSRKRFPWSAGVPVNRAGGLPRGWSRASEKTRSLKPTPLWLQRTRELSAGRTWSTATENRQSLWRPDPAARTGEGLDARRGLSLRVSCLSWLYPFTGSVWAPASTHFTVTLRNDSEKPTWVGSYNTGYRLSWAPVAVTATLKVGDAPSTLPTYTTVSPSSIYIPAGGTATATVSMSASRSPKGAHVDPYPVGVSATVPNGEFDGPPANAGFYVSGSN